MSAEKSERYQFSVIRERIKDHPGQVLDFALGELQQELPASLVGLVTGSGSQILQRANLDEHHAFGERAASYLSREFGVVVEPEQILPVPSGRVAIVVGCGSSISTSGSVLSPQPVSPQAATTDALVLMNRRLVTFFTVCLLD